MSCCSISMAATLEFRFRMINEQDEMRPHIAFFVGGEKTRDVRAPLAGIHEVVIMQALSGG